MRRAVAFLAAAACVGCARSGTSSNGPALEPGALRDSWYAGDANRAGSPPFPVHAYNESFYILRQAACTNYEKPFLYLVFGNERALLLDTGAGNVDVATPVDTLLRNWASRHGRASISSVESAVRYRSRAAARFPGSWSPRTR